MFEGHDKYAPSKVKTDSRGIFSRFLIAYGLFGEWLSLLAQVLFCYLLIDSALHEQSYSQQFMVSGALSMLFVFLIVTLPQNLSSAYMHIKKRPGEDRKRAATVFHALVIASPLVTLLITLYFGTMEPPKQQPTPVKAVRPS